MKVFLTTALSLTTILVLLVALASADPYNNPARKEVFKSRMRDDGYLQADDEEQLQKATAKKPQLSDDEGSQHEEHGGDGGHEDGHHVDLEHLEKYEPDHKTVKRKAAEGSGDEDDTKHMVEDPSDAEEDSPKRVSRPPKLLTKLTSKKATAKEKKKGSASHLPFDDAYEAWSASQASFYASGGKLSGTSSMRITAKSKRKKSEDGDSDVAATAKPASDDSADEGESPNKKASLNDDETAADAGKKKSKRQFLSFVEACQADAIKHCKSRNPFRVGLCLELHKKDLNENCRQYQSAKFLCDMDINQKSLCKSGKPRLPCLRRIHKLFVDSEEHVHPLTKPCTSSSFFQYLTSAEGIGEDDIAMESKAWKLVIDPDTVAPEESSDAPGPA